MLSFYVANLLIPGEPEKCILKSPSGTWTLEKRPDYSKHKADIANGQCAETYFLENPVTLDKGAAKVDEAFDEITPILLAATYLTGLSVTIKHSTSGSECSILQPTEHWPRVRSMDQPSPVVTSTTEFTDQVELFVQTWSEAGQTEKMLLLVHHWLDALACWSMEDLYLSVTTLLQIIVATEATRQNKKELPLYSGVTDAAHRMGIPVPNEDFKKMRNELIHDGRLIGRRFSGPDKAACAIVVADLLNWFDLYMHAAIGLGSLRKARFTSADFLNLNAFSIY